MEEARGKRNAPSVGRLQGTARWGMARTATRSAARAGTRRQPSRRDCACRLPRYGKVQRQASHPPNSGTDGPVPRATSVSHPGSRVAPPRSSCAVAPKPVAPSAPPYPLRAPRRGGSRRALDGGAAFSTVHLTAARLAGDVLPRLPELPNLDTPAKRNTARWKVSPSPHLARGSPAPRPTPPAEIPDVIENHAVRLPSAMPSTPDNALLTSRADTAADLLLTVVEPHCHASPPTSLLIASHPRSPTSSQPHVLARVTVLVLGRLKPASPAPRTPSPSSRARLQFCHSRTALSLPPLATLLPSGAQSTA